jgi:uncharacterized protein YxeA
MKEKMKNLIRRKTLVIPVFLVLIIALIIFGIGMKKDSSVAQDDYAAENSEQVLGDLEKSDIALETANEAETEDKVETENVEYKPEQVPENETSNPEPNDLSASDSSNSGNDEVKNNKDEDLTSVSSKHRVEKVTNSQGETETIYSMTISAYTKDGKPYTKTYSSTNPNETFKYYKDVLEGNKINKYEITMTVTGKEVSRRLVEGGEGVVTSPTPDDATLYRVNVSGYTREGKRFSKTYESTDPNEVITYYKIETRNEEGYLYEIKINMLGKELSKKQVKVDYTYKKTILGEEIEEHAVIEKLDETMEAGKRVVVQEGIDGIIQHVKTEKYLFDVCLSVDFGIKTLRKGQDKIIKIGTLLPLGNSGKTFNSAKEAKSWAEQQSKNNSSKWYNHGYDIFPIDHTEKRFTVDFIKPIEGKPGDGFGFESP